MPLKKKNKIRNRIVFWLTVLIILALMIYVPKKPVGSGGGQFIEYELY